MASAEKIELPKAEYEALLQRSKDLDDLLAAMEADRAGARIPHPVGHQAAARLRHVRVHA